MNSTERMWAGILALLIVGTGCISLGKSKPSDFYVLSSVADSVGAGTVEMPPPGIKVGVMKANIPQTLARPQIVIYPDQNSIHFSESDRWGEPFEDGITRVIMENLVRMIPSRDVYTLPARSALVFDRFVAVDVVHFGYSGEGVVELVTRWTVFDGDRKTVLAEDAARMTEQIVVEDPENLDYRAVSAAMSLTLIKLSHEIATAIQESRS